MRKIKTSQVGDYTVRDYPAEYIDELEGVWRGLECGEDMTAFQFYDWHKNLCTLHRKENTKNLVREIRYVAVFLGTDAVMIAPLEVHKTGIGYKQYGAPRGIYFVGRQGYTDYLNFVYRTFDGEALKILIEYMSQAYHQRRFCLDRMLEKSASYQYLQAQYPGESMAVNCAALVLPDSFDEYRSLLSKSTRQNIRTALNRERKNSVILSHELILDEDYDIKNEIIDLNAQRLEKKKKNGKSEMSAMGRIYCFFADIYRALFNAKPDVVRESKRTFAFLVRDGERLASFYWGIRNDYSNEYYVILAGVNKEYEWYSPNISHMYYFLEEYYGAQGKNIRVIDFTRGGEGYKKTLGCTPRLTASYVFKV